MLRVTVKNALKGGEAVILVQKRGAQQYLVIDRVLGRRCVMLPKTGDI